MAARIPDSPTEMLELLASPQIDRVERFPDYKITMTSPRIEHDAMSLGLDGSKPWDEVITKMAQMAGEVNNKAGYVVHLADGSSFAVQLYDYKLKFATDFKLT